MIINKIEINNVFKYGELKFINKNPFFNGLHKPRFWSIELKVIKANQKKIIFEFLLKKNLNNCIWINIGKNKSKNNKIILSKIDKFALNIHKGKKLTNPYNI